MINADTREIFVYDDIGPSWAGMIGAEDMVKASAELGPGPVSLRINTYGGSVDEALAMIEVMSRHQGDVTVSVDSIAASAGSLFPVAFPSTAARHARVMIHNPWGIVMGNADEMRATADILDVYRDSVVSVYALTMNATNDEIRDLMAAETWFSAEEAAEAGLVGEVTDTAEAVQAKKVAPDRFRHTPQDLLSTIVDKPTDIPLKLDPETPKRVAARLRAMKVAAQIRKRRATA